jgi:hypothetical protein
MLVLLVPAHYEVRYFPAEALSSFSQLHPLLSFSPLHEFTVLTFCLST